MQYQLKNILILSSMIILIGISTTISPVLSININNSSIIHYSPILTSNNQPLAQLSSISEFPANITSVGFRTDYNLNTSTINPFYVTGDNSGNIWFTDYDHNAIYKLDPTTNNYTVYSMPTGINPFILDYAGNNTFWFTDTNSSTYSGYRNICEYNVLNGNLTCYPIPTKNGNPFDLIVHNTTVWFTEWQGKKIGRLDLGPHPTLTEYNASCANSDFCGPLGINIDAQGNVWYVDTYDAAFVKFNPNTGQQQRISLPNQFSAPVVIRFDSNGTMWTGEHAGSNIVHYDPITHNFTMFAVPTPSTYTVSFAGLNDIALDAQGNVWFSEHFINRYGFLKITTNTIMNYFLPRGGNPGPSILWLYIGNDHKVWYAEWETHYIDSVDETKVPSIEISLNNSYIKLTAGSSAEILINVTAILDTNQPLPMQPFTQSALGTSIIAQNFSISAVPRHRYSFLVTVNITKSANAGIYYIPIGVGGNNYTATATLVLQLVAQTTAKATGGYELTIVSSALIAFVVYRIKRQKRKNF